MGATRGEAVEDAVVEVAGGIAEDEGASGPETAGEAEGVTRAAEGAVTGPFDLWESRT